MIAELQDTRPHDHLCLIYETKEDQAEAFVPFLQAGLVRQEKCFYLTDENDPAWVLACLRVNDFPVDDYVASGALSIIHTHDAYLRDGCFDTDKIMSFWEERLNEANAEGYSAVRATAEMTWALTKFPGCDKLVEYESYINTVFPTTNFTGLCQYNRKRFSGSLLKQMIHVHPIVCVGKLLVENPGFVDHEKYSQYREDMEVQSLVDNLVMTRRLAEANAQLRAVIAEKEAAQALIEQRQKECEAMYQELLSLARVVSHEMQAPLSVMQSYLRLLSTRYNGRLGADADEFMDKSVRASKVVVRMIDDLWNYARIDTPSETVREDVNVTHVLCEVLSNLDPLIKTRKAQIDHAVEFPSLFISQRHITFLFQALIENALKYSTPQVPSIHIGWQENRKEIIFHVRDNGPGIDSIHSHDVFKLFTRLHGEPSEDGTGMGLSICKRIVQHYRGKIWFESEFSSGTTFYFSIPKQIDAGQTANVITFPSWRAS